MTEEEPIDRLSQSAALACAVILFALLGGPLLAGQFYLYDDLYTFHLPLRVFYRSCLTAGDDFRWFPQYYCGFDLHGEGQVGMLHPAQLALYGLLPLTVAYPAEFLSHYVVLLVGTYLFLRRWIESPAAAVFGGITFTFFGYNVYHFMHINSIAIVSHLPWSLWLIDLLFSEPLTPSRERWVGFGLALLTGSELLLGYPQSFWLVKLAEGSYVLYLAAMGRRRRPVLVYAGYSALGVLLGCVQLVPTWEALNRSRRAEFGRDTILHGSLHPLNLSQFVAPYLFVDRHVPEVDGVLGQPIRHWELGVYQGALMVPLLFWLALRWSALGPASRRLARYLLGLALIGLLLAMGRHGPFAELLVYAPLVNKFRVPARYLLLVHLGLAGLAAVAVDDLLRGRGEDRRRAVDRTAWLVVIPLASGACCAGVWLWEGYGRAGLPPLGSPVRVLFNLPLLATAAALVALAARRPRMGLVGMLCFTIADQALSVLHLTIREPGSVRPLRAALRALPELPPVPKGYRLHAVRFRPDAPVPRRPAPCLPVHVSLAGDAMTDGYVALTPDRYLDYERSESRRLAGVVWAWDDRDGSWQPAADPLPRARFVTRAIVSDDPARLAELDLETTAVVPEPLPALRGPPGRVMIRRDRPGSFVLDVAVPNRQLLVWNESYHPGWTVTIDGRSRAAVRVNFDYLGCLVPPGRHIVAFRFRPRSFQIGALASAAGLAFLIGMLTIGRRHRPEPVSSSRSFRIPAPGRIVRTSGPTP